MLAMKLKDREVRLHTKMLSVLMYIHDEPDLQFNSRQYQYLLLGLTS